MPFVFNIGVVDRLLCHYMTFISLCSQKDFEMWTKFNRKLFFYLISFLLNFVHVS